MARTIKVPAWKFQIPRLPKYDPDEPDVFEEMTLQEHLVELTDRIKKIVFGIVIAFVVGLASTQFMLDQIVEKANLESGLDIRGPADPIFVFFKIALYIAIGLTLPNIIYQIIAFLAPGLTSKEKRVVFSSLPFLFLLFVGGVAYAYFFAAPAAFEFLSNFQSDYFNYEPDANETLNFFLTLMMGLGIAFELPLVMFGLAKIGIVTPQHMRKWRKYSYLAILIVAAIITPTSDPFNLALVAVPLVFLYEVGIVISVLFAKTSLRAATADATDTAEPEVAEKTEAVKKKATESESPDDV